MDGLTSDLPQLGSDTLETRAQQSGAIWEARQRARQNVTDAFDTIDDPREVPIRRRDRGFGPSEDFLGWAEPQEAAHDLNPRFPNQDLGPQDVERTPDGQGFRAREEVQRTSVAFELDDQFPLVDLGAEDVEKTDDGFGLRQSAQREIAAERFEEDYPGLGELSPQSDVEQTDSGFELRDSVIEENRVCSCSDAAAYFFAVSGAYLRYG